MSDPASIYRERRDRFGRERDAVTVRWGRVANVRLMVFVVAVGVFVAGVWSDSWLLVLLGVTILAGYVALAVCHGVL